MTASPIETYQEQARQAYEESRRMGMLRVGSPVQHVVDKSSVAAIDLVLTELQALASSNNWRKQLEDRLAYYQQLKGEIEK